MPSPVPAGQVTPNSGGSRLPSEMVAEACLPAFCPRLSSFQQILPGRRPLGGACISGREECAGCVLFLCLLKDARSKERRDPPPKETPAWAREGPGPRIKIIACELVSLPPCGDHVFAARDFGACQVLSQQGG